MTKLPKGPLKVIHVNRRAIGENETRARAVIGGEPRRLLPIYTVWTEEGKTEGFEFRVKGTLRGRYEITRFLPGTKFGTPDVRVWLETNDAIEIATERGEFDAPDSTTKDSE